jgi:hypothetical protein
MFLVVVNEYNETGKKKIGTYSNIVKYIST